MGRPYAEGTPESRFKKMFGFVPSGDPRLQNRERKAVKQAIDDTVSEMRQLAEQFELDSEG